MRARMSANRVWVKQRKRGHSHRTTQSTRLFSSMRHRSGFTLIELLVVLILMGLVAVLVVPALFPRHHDQSALNALLVSAREVAARRGEVVYVHIDPRGERRMGGRGHPSRRCPPPGRAGAVVNPPRPPRGSAPRGVRAG